jgi:hypothetical protein
MSCNEKCCRQGEQEGQGTVDSDGWWIIVIGKQRPFPAYSSWPMKKSFERKTKHSAAYNTTAP